MLGGRRRQHAQQHRRQALAPLRRAVQLDGPLRRGKSRQVRQGAVAEQPSRRLALGRLLGGSDGLPRRLSQR